MSYDTVHDTVRASFAFFHLCMHLLFYRYFSHLCRRLNCSFGRGRWGLTLKRDREVYWFILLTVTINAHTQFQQAWPFTFHLPVFCRFTCDPRQSGSVWFGFERRPLRDLCGRSVSPAAGSPQRGVPARLRQLVDELLFNIL